MKELGTLLKQMHPIDPVHPNLYCLPVSAIKSAGYSMETFRGLLGNAFTGTNNHLEPEVAYIRLDLLRQEMPHIAAEIERKTHELGR